MLILSRTVGEEVLIGGGIVVTIINVRGNNVRLGFDAPRSVPIFRREVAEREDFSPLRLQASAECAVYRTVPVRDERRGLSLDACGRLVGEVDLVAPVLARTTRE